MPKHSGKRKLAAHQRLADALRANLSRRKAQQREQRNSTASTGGAAPDENAASTGAASYPDEQTKHN